MSYKIKMKDNDSIILHDVEMSYDDTMVIFKGDSEVRYFPLIEVKEIDLLLNEMV